MSCAFAYVFIYIFINEVLKKFYWDLKLLLFSYLIPTGTIDNIVCATDFVVNWIVAVGIYYLDSTAGFWRTLFIVSFDPLDIYVHLRK